MRCRLWESHEQLCATGHFFDPFTGYTEPVFLVKGDCPFVFRINGKIQCAAHLLASASKRDPTPLLVRGGNKSAAR